MSDSTTSGIYYSRLVQPHSYNLMGYDLFKDRRKLSYMQRLEILLCKTNSSKESNDWNHFRDELNMLVATKPTMDRRSIK